ncbi:MAG: hypothetical protein ACJA0S_000589 [Rickettsiales bacterium]|jgi:hypothetical protein
MDLKKLGTLIIFIIITLPSQSYSANKKITPCNITIRETAYLLDKAEKGDKVYIRALEICKKSNRELFSKLINIDPYYFKFASKDLKNDEVFISKFVTMNPDILKYTSSKLLGNEHFMTKMTRLFPNALKYSAPELMNKRGFVKNMVRMNPRNFSYASYRLQDDKEIALLALKKSGKMLKFASDRLKDDEEIVIQAIESFNLSIDFSSDRLQKKPKIKKLASQIDYSFIEKLDNFLKKNYGGLGVGPKSSRGYHIVNMALYFDKNNINYNPYVTKWEQVYKNGIGTNDIMLDTKSVNDGGWKVDFDEYPELIKEIEKIFYRSKIDQNTIDALNAVSLWKVSTKPLVLAFNLYLLRKINDPYVGKEASNIILLTAIAKKIDQTDKAWEISIVDVIFDANLKMDVRYPSGHRRYKIWDIYTEDENDKNPKILFKVEDANSEYFELFSKQINNRYASIYKGGGYSMEINLFEDLNIISQ